ncbi:hypothetical protein SAMN02927924_02796 [Sphingobium faniae]|nr:hypothetical protein SAMN02927924_02796 [Sphingobium faniae]
MIVRDSVVTNWLKTAAEGEELVYARATFLPVECAVAKRMRDLAAAGHVHLFRRRRQHGAGSENFSYVARRTGRPLPGQAAPGILAVKGVLPPQKKPQDLRCTARAALIRELTPQVRSLLAEGVAPNASRMARMLGVYDHNPVLKVLERLAA